MKINPECPECGSDQVRVTYRKGITIYCLNVSCSKTEAFSTAEGLLQSPWYL